MSALATPTLEQPESTVTCRVLVQPHCGTLLQQHSKWTKKWGQDTAKFGDKAISLSNEAGQLAFTRLQTAFIRISTASPQMVDQLASA